MKEKIRKIYQNVFVTIANLRASIKLLALAGIILSIFIISKTSLIINANYYEAVDPKAYLVEKTAFKEGEKISTSANTDIDIVENADYILGINPKTTNFYIKSKKTDNIWNSTIQTTSEVMTNEEKLYSKSNIILEYEQIALLKQSFSYLSSYQDCVVNNSSTIETYKVIKIDYGFRIEYTIQKQDININYFPKKLTYERYKELISENPLLNDTELKVLKNFYEEDKINHIWLRKDSQPVSNRIFAYNALYGKLGYTIEDLTKDNLVFEIEVDMSKLPSFKISMEVTLDEKGLKVNIPTYNFEDNDVYRIKNVFALPYFGAGAIGDDGYLVVPDGSGALIDYDSYTPTGQRYEKYFYDNDALYNSGYAYSYSATQEICLPVFGNINNTTNTGLMTIVESGAEHAKLYASSSGYAKNKFNLAYTSFSYIIQDKVGLYDSYDSNTVIIEADDVVYYDYTLRYVLLENDNNSYFGMAKSYQDYLINKYNLEKKYTDQPSLYLEALGAVTIERKIFGFTHEKDLTLTTLNDLKTIYTDLKNANVKTKLTYSSWANEGLNQVSSVKLKMMKSLGDKDELKEIINYFNNENVSLSFDLNITHVYENKTNGFNKNKYASRSMDNTALELYRFSAKDYRFDKTTKAYYYLSPKYYLSMTNQVLSNFDKLGLKLITINDLGSEFAADYNRANLISGYSGSLMAYEALESLESLNMTFRNPFAYALKFASNIIDVAYESSDLLCFSDTIPFKELVYNGLIDNTTINLNNNTEDFSNYGLLKAMETGSDIKFLVTYRNSNELKNTEYNYIFSSDYTLWKDEIIDLYYEYLDFYNKIGSRIIINHERISSGVYKVTYSTNKTVIFNHNSLDYDYFGTIIPKKSKVIL